MLNDLLLLTRNPAKFKLATKRYNAPEGFNTLHFQAACSSLSNIKQMDQLVEGIFSSFIAADSDQLQAYCQILLSLVQEDASGD